jgi:hypothetical protein
MKQFFFFECKIDFPFHDRNKKKYINFELNDDAVIKVCRAQLISAPFLKTEKIMNPLDGNSLEVKIPFRYNRVSCKVHGDKILQDLVKGECVEVEIEYNGIWDSGEWCGFSWKLNQLNLTTRADQ